MWKKWLDDRPVLTIGPIAFTDAASLDQERDSVPGGLDVERFLDSALKKYGEHSLVYVKPAI